MKKKNILYLENHAKLQNNIVYEHFKDAFLKIISKVDEMSEENFIDFFFRKLYYPSVYLKTLDKSIELFFKDLDISLIGRSEWELLAFASNYQNASENDRILFLLGKVGTGKSTLIDYVFRYLVKKNSIAEKIIPIIINCQSNHSRLTSIGKDENKLKEFVFNKMLKGKLSKILVNTIDIENNIFWDWYEENAETQYKEHVSDIKKYYPKNTINKKIKELRIEEKKGDDFYFFATKFLQQKENKIIIIIFDNLDPFDISTITNFYWISKLFVNTTSSLRIIMSLRETTYSKIYHSINEIRRIRKWEHAVDFSEILNRRCNNLKEIIDLEYKKRPLILKVKNQEWLISAENTTMFLSKIIGAILNQNGRNYILKISNDNIRSQLELLTIIFSSGMIPKSVFGKILTTDEEMKEKYEIQSSLIVRAVTTFGYSTYFTSKSKENNIPGVVNILSCAFNQNEVNIFIKIFILRYLKNKQGANNINIKSVRLDWNTAIEGFYENEAVVDVFNYCFYRLFNAGLISSPDIHYVQDIDEFIETVSEVSISPLGILYLDDLISNPEYLAFVKDDVYVNDITKFEGCIDVFEKYPLEKQYWRNIYNTVLFLKQYGEMEFTILEKMSDFKTLPFFIQRFSSHDCPMITLQILMDLKSFLKEEASSNNYIMEAKVPSLIEETIININNKLKTIINQPYHELQKM